jgi:tetratricopeptide (TPR) repeat protein
VTVRNSRFLCIAGLAALLSACTSGPSGRYESGSNAFDAPAPRQAVGEAEQLIESGNPSAAAGRLQEIILRYPGTPEAADAQYLLGVAYEDLGSMRDAITAFDAYLDVAPEGEWADDSRIARDRLLHQYEASFPSQDKSDQEIARLRTDAQGQPASSSENIRLADALWKRGDYDSAAKIYISAAKADPNFANSAHFKSRIESRDDGSHIVLTPTEVSRRAAEQNPIQVINTSSFGAIRDSFTQVPLFFVVTGQAVNRGQSVIFGVNVNVTIFGFGNQVYDTASAQLGDMNPGETRAFSLRFSNFRELNSIERYEHSVSFRR